MDFLRNLSPVIIIIHIVTMLILYFIYHRKLQVSSDVKAAVCSVNPRDETKDSALLRKSLVVPALTMLGFILHQTFHLESATVALTGATLLMLVTRDQPEETFLTIEWPSIFFFLGRLWYKNVAVKSNVQIPLLVKDIC